MMEERHLTSTSDLSMHVWTCVYTNKEYTTYPPSPLPPSHTLKIIVTTWMDLPEERKETSCHKSQPGRTQAPGVAAL